MKCKKCGSIEKMVAWGLCRKCYMKEYNTRPDRPVRRDTCKILKRHHSDMKDDPESLSTEFMQEMIGM